jgi:spore coat-associated protein N
MQRFAAVWHASPRTLAGALAMLVVAGALAVGSGASFTSQSASPGNMITAGALTVSTDKGAIFHAANLQPGDTVTGTVTVSNTGDVPGVFSLGMASPALSGTGSSLAGRLQLTVDELDPGNGVTATPLPATLVADVGTAALGTWAGHTSRTYRFSLAWPAGLAGDNAYESSGLSLDFTWNATQA